MFSVLWVNIAQNFTGKCINCVVFAFLYKCIGIIVLRLQHFSVINYIYKLLVGHSKKRKKG